MHRVASLILSLSLCACLCACGPSSTTTSEPTTPGRTAPGDALAQLNARARAGAVTETLHGVEIVDTYRALETESELTRAWVEAQTERTASSLSTDARRAERLRALLSIGSIGRVSLGGERVFYTKRDGDREQPVLLMAENGVPRAEPLIDPTTYGERAALDWYFPSPEGTFIAFGISHNGDERSTLHVMRVASGELLEERIARTKWTTVSWLHDETGFYYSRYPKPGEDDFDADNEDTYFPRVFFHALGENPSADPRFFSGREGTEFPSVTVSDDDRYVVLNNFRGWSASDVYLFDRGDGGTRRRPVARVNVPGDDRPLVPLVTGEDSLTMGHVHDGYFYAQTNKDAPLYRIASAPVDQAVERERWQDVVPQGRATLEDWTIAHNHIVCHYMQDVASKVKVFDMEGREVQGFDLPTRGELEGLSGDPDGSLLAFGFSGYLHAPALFTFNFENDEMTQVDAIDAGLDLSGYDIEQVMVASDDNTQVPVYLIHRNNAERTGEQPVLLYGYGGFNVSLLPSFSRNILYWLERGGIYAVANLRGGGEFGEEWHRAGNLENKERVFEDFESVIGWLTESGWSNPNKIAITGGSNGGLLMGAMITRVPDTFRAAASYVGLYDMVRYHQFPPAELWVSEYGSAENANQVGFLHAYSPYHRVRAGTRYPSVLIETADHDSRVHWAHSTKFAAALQDANAGNNPIYFYMVREVGHGAGTRLTDVVDRYVRMYGFFEHQLGM